MTSIEWLKLWESTYYQCDKVTQSLRDLLGDLDTESPLYQSIWAAFEALTKTVSYIVGDNCELLEWFEIDCDMGKTPRQFTIKHYEKVRLDIKVKSIEDLLVAIEMQLKDKLLSAIDKFENEIVK